MGASARFDVGKKISSESEAARASGENETADSVALDLFLVKHNLGMLHRFDRSSVLWKGQADFERALLHKHKKKIRIAFG